MVAYNNTAALDKFPLSPFLQKYAKKAAIKNFLGEPGVLMSASSVGQCKSRHRLTSAYLTFSIQLIRPILA